MLLHDIFYTSYHFHRGRDYSGLLFPQHVQAEPFFEVGELRHLSEEVQQSLIATTLFPKRLGTAKEYGDLVDSIITNVMLNGETIRLDGSVRLAPR